MKQKLTVTLTLECPKPYRWIARQPWGEWLAFTQKPTIYTAYEDQENDGFVPRYWKGQPDEMTLAKCGVQGGNWRESLKRIGDPRRLLKGKI